MKKTLIAALIAGIPAVAAADVTIYGSLRGALENTNAGGETVNGVNDYTSRIGFKGSEDLGNGLKAIWKVESRINLDGKGSELGSRETWMGLSSEFGTLRMGRINNTLNDLGMMDAWEYGDGVNGLLTFTRTGTRYANSVRYDSPAYYGFTASVGHSFDEKHNDVSGNSAEAGVTYAGLNYENGPFAAYYAFEMQQDAYAKVGGDKKDGQVHRLEATYNANNLFVGAGYQYTKGAVDGGYDGENDVKTQEAALTVGYTLGNLTPKLTYAKGWDMKDVNSGDKLQDSGYDQWIVGVDYALSKRTTAFTSYGQQKFGDFYKTADSDGKIKTFAVGMRHDF